MADNWQPNDHFLIDDITGFKIRASESRKQWNGAITHKDVYESRHQLDLIRARRERPNVPNPRPEPPDVFIGPLTTEITALAIPGATAIAVDSTAGMTAADRISVMLDDGSTHRTTIQTVTDATHLAISNALPNTVSAGKMVIDNTAMTLPTLP